MSFHRSKIIFVAVAGVFCLILAELSLRIFVGLGTPALSMPHPTIEYMFKPDQDVYRFGNHIFINHYGMRNQPFDEVSEAELRIMVFGDSVVNGGNLTDHAALATTILQKELRIRSPQKIIVGNISAGSWGPGNWLAYAERYGFFGAKVVVLVVSSHDYTDNPTFQPLDPNTHPTKPPLSAISEAVERYMLPRIREWFSVANSDELPRLEESAPEKEVRKGLSDLRDFLILARARAEHVLVFQHWERQELRVGRSKIGNRLIRETCEKEGVHPVSLEPYFRRALAKGENPYRDDIHPNFVGQRLIAEAILQHLPSDFSNREISDRNVQSPISDER